MASFFTNRTFLGQITTDAEFRAFAAQMIADFGSCNWVQTSDTGQINTSTVTKPGAANTSAGYAIFRMADSLQATAPVYCKIEFGTGNTATALSIWITVGTGTNGAGTLTGQVGTRFQAGANGTSASNLRQVICGDTNRILMMWQTNSATTLTFGFSIERTHDGTGADTATGIMVAISTLGSNFSSAAGASKWQYIPASGSTVIRQKSGIFVPQTVTSGNYGSDVAIYPQFFEDRGQFLNPSMNLIGYYGADIAADSIVTVNHYGTSHNFYTIGTTGIASVDRESNANISLMVRYE